MRNRLNLDMSCSPKQGPVFTHVLFVNLYSIVPFFQIYSNLVIFISETNMAILKQNFNILILGKIIIFIFTSNSNIGTRGGYSVLDRIQIEVRIFRIGNFIIRSGFIFGLDSVRVGVGFE